MRSIHTFLAVLILAALAASCGDTGRRPNVVLLVMDTARGDRCSVNGYGRETTPQLEKLAAEGLNFRNTWAPAGWTGPSHASLFTGLRPNRHGFFQGNREFLDDRAVTLAERMRKAGYRTGCFSNNPYVSPDHGLTQGFQHIVRLFDDPPPIEPPSVRTHAQALEWVRGVKRDGAPFFLFINDMEPHLPYTPPEEFARRFVAPDLPPETVQAARNLKSEQWFQHNLGIEPVPPEQIRALSGLYDGEIAFLDQEVGRLADALRHEGLLDETLFVVTSDHGEYLGEHGMLSHEFGLYRSLRHVPLVIRLPGGARAGEVSDHVVRLEDVYPTIEEVCGLPARRSLDGQTLLGDHSGRRAIGLRGPPVKMLEKLQQEEKLVFDMSRLAVGISATFDGRYHRIDYSDGRVRVFDILVDPDETSPLD